MRKILYALLLLIAVSPVLAQQQPFFRYKTTLGDFSGPSGLGSGAPGGGTGGTGGSVTPLAVSLSPAFPATAYAGTSFSTTAVGSGGVGEYRYTRTGRLPGTFSIDGNVVSGVYATGSYNFNIRALDDAGTSVSTSPITVSVVPKPVMAWATQPGDIAVVQGATAQTPFAVNTGGVGSPTYSLKEGSANAPSWIRITGTNVVATPTTAVTPKPYYFTIVASDPGREPLPSESFTVTVSPVPAMTFATEPGNITVIKGYTGSTTFAVNTGGVGTPTYTLENTAGGALPAGVTVTAAGVSVAASTPIGSYSLKVVATHSATSRTVKSATFTVKVDPVPAMAFTTQPGNFTAIQGYTGTTTFAVNTGGVGTPAYTLETEAGGTAPAWITVTSTGVSARPTSAIATAPYNFRVVATDAANSRTVKSSLFTVTVAPVPAMAFTTQPGNISVAQGATGSISYAVNTGGIGAPVYTLKHASGTIPSWITVTSNSVVAKPVAATALGSYTFTVEVSDTGRSTITSTPFTVSVVSAIPAMTWVTQPVGGSVAQGASGVIAYSVNTGGVGAPTYALKTGLGGAPDSWMTWTSTAVTARPSTAVTTAMYPFYIEVKDTGRATLTSNTFYVNVTAPLMAFTTQPSNFDAIKARTTVKAFAVDTQGATPTYSVVVASSTSTLAPSWLTASASGVQAAPLSTTYPTTTPYAVKMSATGRTDVFSSPFTVNVIEAPMVFASQPQSRSIPAGMMMSARTDIAFSVNTGGIGSPQYSTVYSATGAAAPTWFSTSAGEVRVQPPSTQPLGVIGPFRIKVTDTATGRPQVLSDEFSITVTTQEMEFTAQPSTYFELPGYVITSNFAVSTYGGTPTFSVVDSATKAVAPSWITTTSTSVSFNPPTTVARGNYGPYQIKVSNPGKPDLYSLDMDVFVVGPNAATTRPATGRLYNFTTDLNNNTPPYTRAVSLLFDGNYANAVANYQQSSSAMKIAELTWTDPVVINKCLIVIKARTTTRPLDASFSANVTAVTASGATITTTGSFSNTGTDFRATAGCRNPGDPIKSLSLNVGGVSSREEFILTEFFVE